MDENFTAYLSYILLVGAALLSLLFFTLSRRRKQKAPAGKRQLLQCGNVGVFFDVQGGATILPYVKDKFGAGKATGRVWQLRAPYTHGGLGQVIRAAMQSCDRGAPGMDDELMSFLGFRNWKDFSEGKRNISIHYQEQYGIVMHTTRRKPDGAYHFNGPGFEKALPPDADDRELGEAVLTLLPRCKC